ncbi:hypothetical protein D3C78_1558060 [compost metagenome]
MGAERRQGGDELRAGPAGQQGRLALVQTPVGVVVGLGVGRVVLRAGVVAGGARVVAAWWAFGLPVDHWCFSHGFLLGKWGCQDDWM